MRHNLLLLPICWATAFASVAQSPASEFVEGKVTKFSTRGHSKAKGAVFTLKYPNSWAAKEGERTNIVQKFISESGKGLEHIIIVTKSLPSDLSFSEADQKAFLSPEALKETIPDDAKFIRATPTKIEGSPAGILEYSVRADRAGIEIDMHIVSLIFFQAHTMVQIQFQVAGVPSKASDLADRVAAFRPLFQLVMNSVVFDDKWK
jgi:hypothetical protein